MTMRWFLSIVVFYAFSIGESSSSPSSSGTLQSSSGGAAGGGGTTAQLTVDMVINCTAYGGGPAFPLKGRLYAPKSMNADAAGGGSPHASSASNGGTAGGSNSGGRGAAIFARPTDDLVENVTLDNVAAGGGGGESCGSINILKQSAAAAASEGDKWKLYVMTGQISANKYEEGGCAKAAVQKFVESMGERSPQCLLILYANKEASSSADDDSSSLSTQWLESDSTLKDKVVLFFADFPASAAAGSAGSTKKYLNPESCAVPIRPSDEDPSQQDSLLNNFSRTSVLFVSVSFIILMVISLAWLVFYYVQRFRYAHAKDRLARRLFNAAKKALTKIPAKTLRQGDKELDSDCPVCIEPYHASDVIRILPCKHVFHKTCVDPWLLEHRTCPMCKMDILKAFGYHFGHSEESVRDADQMSAGGQSTDGVSGATGSGGGGGRGGGGGGGGQHHHHGFPMSLPTESDLHDPFFPSPVPSPSLLQPVLHSGNAQSFNIIPLTVHRHNSGGRGSDSSADSADHWIPGTAATREHSAEVHYGGGAIHGGDEPQNTDPASTTATIINVVDDNHNDPKAIQRHPSDHHELRRSKTAAASGGGIRRPESAGARGSTASRSSYSSSSSSSSSASQRQQQQQRQPLFHSRSAGVLRDAVIVGGETPVHTIDSSSCESDDGGGSVSLVESSNARKNYAAVITNNNKRRRRAGDEQSSRKSAIIVSRARSQTVVSTAAPNGTNNKANSRAKVVAVCTTPPPTAAGQPVTTTTMVIGRESVSSISPGSSSSSDCVVVGVLNPGMNIINNVTSTTTKNNSDRIGSLESL